MKDPQEEEV